MKNDNGYNIIDENIIFFTLYTGIYFNTMTSSEFSRYKTITTLDKKKK